MKALLLLCLALMPAPPHLSVHWLNDYAVEVQHGPGCLSWRKWDGGGYDLGCHDEAGVMQLPSGPGPHDYRHFPEPGDVFILEDMRVTIGERPAPRVWLPWVGR